MDFGWGSPFALSGSHQGFACSSVADSNQIFDVLININLQEQFPDKQNCSASVVR